ncbi:MAG: hypothetical protein WBD74_10185, partial [Candidatus Aquilonibacter sp.]
LARSAADVLEVLRLHAPAQQPAVERDGKAGELLRALRAGESDLDTLVAATGIAPPQALAELAMLELEGVVERRGATRFACSFG